jgi:hypothetical protein
MLTLLEQIENNLDLLSSIRKSLQQQTEASDDNTQRNDCHTILKFLELGCPGL